MATEKPLYLANSIQQLADNAEAIDIDKSFKIYHYFCTSNNLVKQANIYKNEGDIEKAYIYLLRFCILALEKLPTHPEYNDINFTKFRDQLRRDAGDKVGELEKLKSNLSKRYQYLDTEREKKLELEQSKIQEVKRLAQEKKIKEENDRLAKLEEQNNLELEKEIQKIQLANEEVEDFNKRKSDYEKKLRQTRFQRQAELLREEAKRQEQELELKTKLDLQQQQQNLKDLATTSSNDEIQQTTSPQIDDTSSPILEAMQVETNDTLNINSDELLKYLEKSKDDKLSASTSSIPQNNDLLIDLPDFVQPKSNSVPVTPIINSSNVNNSNINASPQTLSTPPNNNIQNIPTTFGGYPSFQQLQQSVVSNPNPNQYTTSPPYNLPISNNNRPYIPNQSPTIPQFQHQNNYLQNAPPPYQPFNQFSSPIPNQPVHFNNQHIPQLPHQNMMKPPQHNPPINGFNPSIPLPNHFKLPPNLMSPPQYTQQLPQLPQQPQAKVNSYLANIQKPPVTNMAGINSVANNQQIATQPNTATSKPKANIDSPEASKKYNKLRRIIINVELLNEFMRLADGNTRNSVETCGILSGTLSNDIFKVTTLIIPKQEGTSDTCNTIDEHEIFEYQLENDLLTLGWIHTHPTQDCFLSAVDVHTHCSYQYLLPEAVAIVMSPRANPKYGIFRLTDPPGIQTVQKCKLKSFHPHPPVDGIPIYHKADHAELIGGKNDWKAVDLRKKK